MKRKWLYFLSYILHVMIIFPKWGILNDICSQQIWLPEDIAFQFRQLKY